MKIRVNKTMRSRNKIVDLTAAATLSSPSFNVGVARLVLNCSRRVVALAAVLALSACVINSKPLTPAIDIPPAYTASSFSGAAMAESDWWRGFNADELSSLIASALRASPDMAIAAERILQAEAQVRIAGASLFPALSSGASISRRDSHPEGGPSTSSESTSVTVSASYELDLWGRNASDARVARFALSANRFDRETVRLTLVTGVANAYFQVLSLRGRLAVARENLTIAERVLGVVDTRARNGAVSPLDVARQQTAVLSQRATIPALELQERQTLFALAVLLGRPPQDFDLSGSTVSGLTVPSAAPGLPADLLMRRPDLAAAEAQLAAANANVAAARAALFPSIQLTGSTGLASDMLLNVLHSPTVSTAVGASLLQPIFDAGRLRGQVDIAKSRERELVENYRKSILTALADVETALASVSRIEEQERLQEQVLEQARRVMRIAEIRYREGVDDLLSVLDAQRTLFQAEDQLAQTRFSRLQASVGFFKALGGGWQMNLPLEKASQGLR